MTLQELRKEIDIELELIETILKELSALRKDVAGREPSVREKTGTEPLLYYKTKEDIAEYRRKPVELKLQWLQTQMEFFCYAMPEKAKKIRERFTRGQL